MTWEYKYDIEADETAIYWDNIERVRIDGKITSWKNGYPAKEEEREAIAEAIQAAGTPDRIRMQFDFNYGFSKREE